MEYNKTLFAFESRWVAINGIDIHYVDEGSGQILLFSHPPLGSSFMYREFINLLRPKFRCIALDYPGFGLSKSKSDYQYDILTQSQYLEAFIKQLKLENIIVMGHDTGGPSAFIVASKYPDLFSGLILTDTIIFPVSEYPKIDRMLSIVGSRVFQSINAWTNLLVALTFNFGIRTRKLQKPEIRQYKQLFNSAKRRKRITQLLHSLKLQEDMMKSIKSAFETILNEKPTLLIYGQKDPVYEMGIADRINDLLANAELHLIDNEGHFPHEGQPGEMAEIINNWIQSNITIPI